MLQIDLKNINTTLYIKIDQNLFNIMIKMKLNAMLKKKTFNKEDIENMFDEESKLI